MTLNYYQLNATQQEMLTKQIEKITKYIYKHLYKRNRPKLYEMNYHILDIFNSVMTERCAIIKIEKYCNKLDFHYIINYSKRRIIKKKEVYNNMVDWEKNNRELLTYLYYEFSILNDMYDIIDKYVNSDIYDIVGEKLIKRRHFKKWIKEIKL